MSNDNLEPYKSGLIAKFVERARTDDHRYPYRDVFRRFGRRIDHRPASDWDELYYLVHRHWLVQRYKNKKHPFEVSAEKMEQVKAAYSADTFPRLRAVVQHRGCYFFIAGLMYTGDVHPPLGYGYRIVPGDQPEDRSDYYVGKVVHCRGMSYVVTHNEVVFYSFEDESPQPEQEDLFG